MSPSFICFEKYTPTNFQLAEGSHILICEPNIAAYRKPKIGGVNFSSFQLIWRFQLKFKFVACQVIDSEMEFVG